VTAINDMKSYQQIFVEPEWWLEIQHWEHLGKERFCPSGRVGESQAKKSSKVFMNPVTKSSPGKLASMERVSECLGALLDQLGG